MDSAICPEPVLCACVVCLLTTALGADIISLSLTRSSVVGFSSNTFFDILGGSNESFIFNRVFIVQC